MLPGKTPSAAVELYREGRPLRVHLSRVGGFRREKIAASGPGATSSPERSCCPTPWAALVPYSRSACVIYRPSPGMDRQTAAIRRSRGPKRSWPTSNAHSTEPYTTSSPSICHDILPSSPKASTAGSRFVQSSPGTYVWPYALRRCLSEYSIWLRLSHMIRTKNVFGTSSRRVTSYVIIAQTPYAIWSTTRKSQKCD